MISARAVIAFSYWRPLARCRRCSISQGRHFGRYRRRFRARRSPAASVTITADMDLSATGNCQPAVRIPRKAGASRGRCPQIRPLCLRPFATSRSAPLLHTLFTTFTPPRPPPAGAAPAAGSAPPLDPLPGARRRWSRTRSDRHHRSAARLRLPPRHAPPRRAASRKSRPAEQSPPGLRRRVTWVKAVRRGTDGYATRAGARILSGRGS